MADPNSIVWITIVGAIISTLGGLAAIYGNLYKLKPESKKLESEGESEIADAAASIANGAKVSNDMLLARLIEMEKREKDRDMREADLLNKVQHLEASLADWQDWANRLVHQLRSLRHEPVPFKLVPNGNGDGIP